MDRATTIGIFQGGHDLRFGEFRLAHGNRPAIGKLLRQNVFLMAVYGCGELTTTCADSRWPTFQRALQAITHLTMPSNNYILRRSTCEA